MRFLLATWEGGGVVPPEMGVARRLLARGHEVRVLADPAVEAAARAIGADFSPWVRAPFKRSLAPEEDSLRDWEYKNLFKLFQHVLDGFLCGPADRFAAGTLEALDRHPVDALIADMTILGAIMAGEVRGLPCAVLVPNIYMRPTPGIPPIGPGFLPANGAIGRLRDAALRRFSARLWKKGLPANVKYVGPILDDPAWAGSTWTPPWPAGNHDPLVLVALSSTFQNQVDVLTRIASGLAGIRARVLITLGPALDPSTIRTANNVVCVPTAPHGLIIPHAAVVITHCGRGTTLRTLAAGVPVVCMPMGRDQKDTAARVVARGAGVRLKPSASPAAIRRAVESVLAAPRFKAAGARLQHHIAVEVAANDVALDLESIAS